MKVLSSIAYRGSDPNQFVNEYWQGLGDRHEMIAFDWPSALMRRYDIFHVQWPEYLCRCQGAKGLLKFGANALLLAKLKLFNVPVIQTVHNVEPHDSAGFLERILQRSYDRITVGSIFLNESAENDMKHGVTILHGAYTRPDGVEDGPRGTDRFRIISIGSIRRYKGYEDLIDAFSSMRSKHAVDLVVAGAPSDIDYVDKLRALVDQVDGADIIARYLDESSLWELILGADLVVLPYRYFYNSGVSLLALSAGRPVLVPDSASSRSLQAEVGTEWVSTFAGRLDSADLESALGKGRGCGSPVLAGRAWSDAVSHYSEVFFIARAARKEHRSSRRARQLFRRMVGQSSNLTGHSATNLQGERRGGVCVQGISCHPCSCGEYRLNPYRQ